MIRFACLFAIAAALLLMPVADVQPAFAEAPLSLDWDKLLPKTAPLENPYDNLPPEQQAAIDVIGYRMSFPSGPMPPDLAPERDLAQKDVDAVRRKMAKNGVDIDSLYRRYVDWQAEIERRGKLTMKEYDGKSAAIAGYLLPLEFNAAGVREFLLVPYVGACIHVPPPPPNQVVYVKTAKPYKLTDMYESVLVKGPLKVAPVSRKLSFMDGTAEVDAGYSIDSDSIERYEYQEGNQ